MDEIPNFILPLDYDVFKPILMDYEVTSNLTSTKGIIDFYTDWHNAIGDKTRWEVL